MSKSPISPGPVRTAAAAAALLVVVGNASAAQWQGTWDPWFGAPFSNLFFSGSATFDSGTCSGNNTSPFPLSANPTWDPTECPGMSITNVTMLLTNYDIALGPGSVALPDSQSWNLASMPVNWMRIESGSLVGVYSPWVTLGQGTQSFTSIPFPSPPSIQPYFGIQFRYEYTSLSGWQTSTYLGYKYADDSILQFDCIGNTQDALSQFCGARPATVTITPAVPEPSTYALMGMGLAAVVAMRRRAVRRVREG